ncbi:MAG: methyltransferase domain-containing protein [Snowella sp.]|nr:methyltransferase domain-containing protein [Snowella sp.]
MSNDLYQQIQQFYDASSGLWEEIWGEHMHHGYYGRGGTYRINRRQAQIDLIEELLVWAEGDTSNNPPSRILDLGCGIGGSSLYLAEKLGAQVTGISLSPVQIKRARERALNQGLANQVTFEVANALEMPFADQSFDWVWSLESGEHMPDKTKFLQECYRVLKPGGRLILATWCHRPTTSWAGSLTADEKRHLQAIYQVYCLPFVLSLPDYEAIALDCGFQALRSEDWSLAVAPFWDQVIDSAITPKAIAGLLQAGCKTIEAALSLRLMQRGYQRGLIRFGLLTAIK